MTDAAPLMSAPAAPNRSPDQAACSDDDATVIAFLRRERPELLGPFLDRLPEARRRILHRLLSALIRERVIEPSKRSMPEGSGMLKVDLSNVGTLRVRVNRHWSLDRLDFEGDLEWVDDRGGSSAIVHPRRLLELVLHGRGPDAAGPLAEELDNSVSNYALALVGADRRRRALREAARDRGCRTVLDWVAAEVRRDPEFSPLVFFEQWVIDGHPLHPSAKIKRGMGPADAIRYTPEWGARPGVVPVAVARRACAVTASDAGQGGSAAILLREHPEIRSSVESALATRGRGLDEFELIPVHPWQLEHTLPRLHAEAIARGIVIPIPEAMIPASALMSVRSLATKGPRGEGRHQIKTAIDVQMTNAVRSVSPQAAENGPILTRVLAEIQKREMDFEGRFGVLREDLGISYRPPDDPGLDPETIQEQARHLGAIFREDPEDGLEDGMIALPAAALVARSPLGDATIVLDLLHRFAEAFAGGDLVRAAPRFLARYAEIALPGPLTLMVRYGIAIEGHLQNCVPVFRLDDGSPVRMRVRDLGGVRVLNERLGPLGLAARLAEGSSTRASDAGELRDKIDYALIQNHFGELIKAIARHVDIDERRLWRPVAATLRRCFETLKADPALSSRAEGDEAALFGPTLRLKALVRMRVRGDVTDYQFAEVSNPLHHAERGPLT